MDSKLTKLVNLLQQKAESKWEKRYKTLAVVVNFIADLSENEERADEFIHNINLITRLVSISGKFICSLTGSDTRIVDVETLTNDYGMNLAVISELITKRLIEQNRNELPEDIYLFYEQLLTAAIDVPRIWTTLSSKSIIIILENLDEGSKELRLTWCNRVEKQIHTFAELVFSSGDYSVQHDILLLVHIWLKWASKEQKRKLIQNFKVLGSEKCKTLLSSEENEFITVRMLLNNLNKKVETTQVKTLECLYLFGEKRRIKPTRLYSKIYVDFGLSTKRMHFNYSMPNEEIIDLNILFQEIHSVCISWNKNENLTKDEQNDQTMMMLHIHLKRKLPKLGDSLMFLFQNISDFEHILSAMKYPIHLYGDYSCEWPGKLKKLLEEKHNISCLHITPVNSYLEETSTVHDDEINVSPSITIPKERTPVVKVDKLQSPPVKKVDKLQSPPVVKLDKLQSPPVVKVDKLQSPPVVKVDKLQSPPVKKVHKLKYPPVVKVDKLQSPPVVKVDKLQSPPVVKVDKLQSPPVKKVHKLKYPRVVKVDKLQSPPVVKVDKLQSSRKRKISASTSITLSSVSKSQEEPIAILESDKEMQVVKKGPCYMKDIKVKDSVDDKHDIYSTLVSSPEVKPKRAKKTTSKIALKSKTLKKKF